MTDAELFVRGPIVQDFFSQRTICDTCFQVSKRKLSFILEQHFQRGNDHYSVFTNRLSLSRFCHLRMGIAILRCGTHQQDAAFVLWSERPQFISALSRSRKDPMVTRKAQGMGINRTVTGGKRVEGMAGYHPWRKAEAVCHSPWHQ